VLSQVSLHRGDVILVCSDGLHGPVSDDEIKQILLDEPDVKKPVIGSSGAPMRTMAPTTSRWCWPDLMVKACLSRAPRRRWRF